MAKKRARTTAASRKLVTRTHGSAPTDYRQMLDEIKSRIRQSRIKAALAVNRELIELYWEIGRRIVDRQSDEGWGRSVVEQLSADLRREFPDLKGFSTQNLWYMRSFYLAWNVDAKLLQQPVGESPASNLQQPVGEIPPINLQQAVGDFDGKTLPATVAEIPWGHNLQLLSKLNSPIERLWYAQQTVVHGWSRAVLVHQIESGAFGRQGKAITSFHSTLPALQSEFAQQLTKDPYQLDFLGISDSVSELELERGLIENLQRFLMELGKGFAFVGRQFPLHVDGQDFFIDLLFYHVPLGCYFVIDLKVEEFKPEFVGKMSFYLTAVDETLENPTGNRSIGLILCKNHRKTIVEYTLRDESKPVGVSRYETVPPKLRGELPTKQQLNELINASGNPTATSRLGRNRAAKRNHKSDGL